MEEDAPNDKLCKHLLQEDFDNISLSTAMHGDNWTHLMYV